MVERSDVAGWLEGPGRKGESDPGGYAGKRLGLPESGVGSIVGFGPRLVAYLIDSVACTVIAYGLLRDQRLTLLVFVLEVVLLTWLAGGSAGQIVRGMRVVRLDREPVGFVRSLLRTVLLTLLVPALVWDRDGRGLHDRSVGTAVVRIR